MQVHNSAGQLMLAQKIVLASNIPIAWGPPQKEHIYNSKKSKADQNQAAHC
jgi:hypothetical protein